MCYSFDMRGFTGLDPLPISLAIMKLAAALRIILICAGYARVTSAGNFMLSQ